MNFTLFTFNLRGPAMNNQMTPIFRHWIVLVSSIFSARHHCQKFINTEKFHIYSVWMTVLLRDNCTFLVCQTQLSCTKLYWKFTSVSIYVEKCTMKEMKFTYMYFSTHHFTMISNNLCICFSSGQCVDFCVAFIGHRLMKLQQYTCLGIGILGLHW